MISANNLKKQYGKDVLFEDVTFTLGQRERIGIVGRNGHGKTTLFKILVGEESPDEGEIIIPKGYKLGYLNQNIICSKPTVLEECCLGLPANKEEDGNDHWKAKKILSGLGFLEKDFTRSPLEFSGGYQMRIALARLLVSKPDLLLIDEPTNFLDIISIRWLTSFLRSWPGELLMISHDRTFMDNIVTHIMGIHRKRLRKMQGSTGHYYEQVRQEEDIYERRRINDGKIRKKEEEFIDKFRAKARRASQAQSRLKRLEKMGLMSKLDSVETLYFSFNYSLFEAKYLMEAHNICFGYDKDKPLLIDSFSLSIQKNDKICIIGQNGSGKTTLLRLLTGGLNPLKGEVKNHQEQRLAYFEQANTSKLNNNNTVEEEIASCLESDNRPSVRAICGAMMFPGDKALKKISVLSGGERSRVMLGKILASPANLLMLDEPTHHLDMESCQTIIKAVKDFEGAAVVVSHDESFLRNAANKLKIFQGNKIQVFPGTYDEFLDRIGWQAEGPVKINNKSEKPMSKKEARIARAELLAKQQKELNPLKQKIDQLENEILDLEEHQKKTTQDMILASEKQDSVEIVRLTPILSGLNRLIEKKYEGLIIVHQEYEEKNKLLGGSKQ